MRASAVPATIVPMKTIVGVAHAPTVTSAGPGQ
jgi:hypothetical protein